MGKLGLEFQNNRCINLQNLVLCSVEEKFLKFPSVEPDGLNIPITEVNSMEVSSLLGVLN